MTKPPTSTEKNPKSNVTTQNAIKNLSLLKLVLHVYHEVSDAQRSYCYTCLP